MARAPEGPPIALPVTTSSLQPTKRVLLTSNTVVFENSDILVWPVLKTCICGIKVCAPLCLTSLFVRFTHVASRGCSLFIFIYVALL